jgi:HSP20 family protein
MLASNLGRCGIANPSTAERETRPVLQEGSTMADPTTTLEKSAQKPAATPPATATKAESAWQPILALREEMDRLFDNFWRGFGMGRPVRRMAEPQPLGRFMTSLGMAIPDIDIVEAEKEYRIVAELPGMSQGDVDLSVSGDVLTIKGEKKEQKEEKGENYHLSERRFGSFQRSLQLPQGIDRDKIEARFDKGVLTVTLSKTAEAAARRQKIDIKEGS